MYWSKNTIWSEMSRFEGKIKGENITNCNNNDNDNNNIKIKLMSRIQKSYSNVNFRENVFNCQEKNLIKLKL